MANNMYTLGATTEAAAKSASRFIRDGVRNGGYSGLVQEVGSGYTYNQAPSETLKDGYPPVALVINSKISQMNNSAQVQIRDIVTGALVKNVEVMYPCLSLNPITRESSSKYLVFYGKTTYIANLENVNYSSQVKPKQKGLSQCYYTSPYGSSVLSNQPGVFYAEDDRSLYAYYDSLQSTSKYFVWYSTQLGKHIMTKDNPIVAFYIDGDSQLLQFVGYKDGQPRWESDSYILRFSLFYNAWLLYSKSVNLPYIPTKTEDTSAPSWYWAQSLDTTFFGQGGASSESLSLQVTYAMIQNSNFAFQIDQNKQVRQTPPAQKISFGYPQVTLTISDESTTTLCYYARVEQENFTFKLVNILTNQEVAVYTYSDTSTSSLAIKSSGAVFKGGAMSPQGTTTFTKQDDSSITATVQFTGNIELGTQKVVCYYGEVSTWR